MTEIERARRWIMSGMWTQDVETTNMLGVIDTALREQVEREKGCEYCRDEKPMFASACYLEDTRFYLAGNALTYAAYVYDAGGGLEDNTFIHFCPMCGRRLVKEVKQDE